MAVKVQHESLNVTREAIVLLLRHLIRSPTRRKLYLLGCLKSISVKAEESNKEFLLTCCVSRFKIVLNQCTMASDNKERVHRSAV